MFAPVVLVISSLLAAAVVAYGAHPNWAQQEWGLELIYLSRRLQWPMVTLCLGLCIALIGLVITGKQRAWWLIALAPILAMFVHRFSTRSLNAFTILESPVFVRAVEATHVADDAYVVGLKFGNEHYAYPYELLYTRPVVVQQDHDRRMLLMWSAFANRAAAVHIDRDLKARDLEIVSMPANALLLYNQRLGEFINGLTLENRSGNRPAGIGASITTHKMQWRDWRAQHPQTRVLAPLTASRNAPAAPALPYYDLPPQVSEVMPAQETVVVVMTDPPIAIPTSRVLNEPMNLRADSVPILLLRDRETGRIRAFDRRVESDLTPIFRVNTDARRRGVALVDSDTTIGWSATGRAVDGDPAYQGRQLNELPVESHLYWGVMKFWFPNLLLHQTDLLGDMP